MTHWNSRIKICLVDETRARVGKSRGAVVRLFLTLLAFVAMTLAFSQPLPTSSNLRLTVADTPFAAFQDGNAAWQRLKLGLNTVLVRDARARFAVVWVCQENSKTDSRRTTRVRVLKLTVPEAAKLELRCPKPASVTLSGKLEQVNSTCVNLHLAGRRSQWCNYDSPDKTSGRFAIAANLGKFDVFAAPIEPTDGAPMLERLLIARDVKIVDSQQQNLNLANAIKLVPKTLSVTAPSAVKLAQVTADYWSNDGSLIGLGGSVSSSPDENIPQNVAFGSLPANQQLASEHYLFRATAPVNFKEQDGIAGINASVNHSPAAKTTLFLAATIPAPKILSLGKASNTSELALEITWDAIDNASAYSWRLNNHDLDWLVYITSAYLGNARTPKDSLPELLKTPGWNRKGDWGFYGIRGSQPIPLEFHAVLERKGFSFTAASALLSQNDSDLSLEKAVNGSSLIAAGALMEVNP